MDQHGQVVNAVDDFIVALLVLLKIDKSVVNEGLGFREGIEDVEVVSAKAILIVVVIVRTDARGAERH